jgi:glycosyltransferase involved in cell wall biosynthesis
MRKKKYLFLYTELAAYFISCLEELIKTGEADVYLIRWPLNKEAPFDFRFPEGLHVYNRNDLTKENLLNMTENIQPDLIFCSGWMDKDYLEVCKRWKKKIPVVAGIDNQWDGSFRQRIAAWFSFTLIRPYFNHAWVPGELQKKFALKLGFKDNDIRTGFYAADINHFNQFYKRFKETKQKHFPKRFIYVGRYLPFKGIFEMWEAFIELKNEFPNDWELWCLGTGDMWDKRTEHPSIRHFGFVQPAEMENFIRDTGVFILPSTFEPWGVVVHEFAASGFPILCSSKVGSCTYFLKNNENGYSFQAGNKEIIKKVMLQMMRKTNDELNEMSGKSAEISRTITPSTWVKQLQSFFNKPAS